MNRVSFLVALLAFLQISAGSQAFGQERLPGDRRTVEEALDRAGEDIADELEALIRELESSAQAIGLDLERWAEENSEELDAWSEKHSQQWEAWGEQFSQKMERLTANQENAWGRWAQGYEQDLQRWKKELASDELEPEQLGQFVERNLKSLSKMPLGQLVDEALEEGLGQLSEAPWDSLEELGALAQDAVVAPVGELSQLLEEGSEQRKSLTQGAEKIHRALEQLDDDISRNLSDSDVAPPKRIPARDRNDARIDALNRLLDRDDVDPEQRERILDLIRTIQDASQVESNRSHRLEPPRDSRSRVDVPPRDQLKERLKREKQKRIEELEKSRRESIRRLEDARQEMRDKTEQQSRKIRRRLPIRPDGKNADGRLKKPVSQNQDARQQIQRDGRDGKANRKPVAKTNRTADKSDSGKPLDSELDSLRIELAKLRKEVEQLKKNSDK